MRRNILFGCGIFLAGALTGALALQLSRSEAGPLEVEIARQIPDGPADLADRLALVFDRQIVPAERVGQPLGEPPFQLDPPRKGRWTFAATDRIEYQLEEQLEAGRQYALKPTPACERALGARLIGERTATFTTESLKVLQCGIASSDKSHVNVEITFNQPVNGTALEQALQVRDLGNQQPLKSTLLTRQNTKTHSVRFDRPTATSAMLTIAERLTPADGDLSLGVSYEQQLTCHELLDVEYVYAHPHDFADEATIRLNFNNRLKRNAAIPQVSISPPVAGIRTSIYYDSLSIEGPFECGKRYAITVEPGLVARNGTITKENITKTVQIPDRDPQLRLTTGRGVLSPAGHMLLDVETVNYNDLTATVTRLYPNNLVAHLHGGDADTTGKEILSKKLTVSANKNELAKSVLNLGELIERQPGIYHVSIKGDQSYWHNDSAVIAVSDLAIAARMQKDGVFCWVTSIANSTTVDAVKLRAYSYTNQLLAEATTDEQGRALLELPTGSGTEGDAWVIVAEKDHDLSYLLLDRDNWSPEQNDLAGRPPVETYDAFVYTERGAYRPGDVIHLTGILRDQTGVAPPPFPISITAKRPDGKTLVSETIRPDESLGGFFHLDVPTPPSAQLGRYTFSVSIPGTQKDLGTATALVESILPVRLEVAAASAKPTFLGKEKPQIDIDAQYLFGKPAAALPATVSGQYVRRAFKPSMFEGFVFEPLKIEDEQVIEEISTTLDDAGHATVNIPAASGPGLWEARVAVTVTEPGSRSVSQRLSFGSDPADRHLGMRLPIGNAAPSGETIEVQWAQVTGQGEWADGKPIALLVERIEYDWAIRDTGSGMRWESTERRIEVATQNLNQHDPASSGTVPVALSTPGQYQLRLTEPESGLTAEWALYVRHRDAHDESFAVALPEQVELKLDDSNYLPGDTATATVRAGMKGTLLVALETDRVIWSQALKMTGNTETIEVPIPDDLRRDAFLTASVIRPLNLEATKWKPLRARGITRVPVDFNQRALTLELDAPVDARPGSEVTIKARVTTPDDESSSPTVVHVFAVDEGLLLPTAFKTPDPLAHFFAPRAATIEHFDIFNRLLPDYVRPLSTNQIGAGDDDFNADGLSDDALMRSLVSMERQAGFVAWQKALPVDENGEVSFAFIAPPTQGRLRVMALAVHGDRYASNEMPVVLSAPLMVEAQWPRFLSPGDEAWVPVKIFNQSDAEHEIEIDIIAADGVEVAEVETETFTIAADSSQTVWLKLIATQPGRASIRVTARWKSADNNEFETAESTGMIPVRPLTSIRTVSYTQRVPAGESWQMPNPGGFLDGTLKTRIQVQPTPAAELMPAYEALLDYPHGCLEQTSSRVHGLICAREIIETTDDERADIDNRIHAGLVRIWSMQTTGGGLAFWPNNPEPNLWGTTYATQVLLAAKTAGFEINNELLDGVERYLARAAKRMAESNDENDQSHRLTLLPAIAFVLTQLDAAPLGMMANLSDDADQLDLEGRCYLARAWLSTGHRDRAAQLLSDGVLNIMTSRALGAGRITSPIRQQAVLLDALLDFNHDDEPEHQVVAQLLAAREQSRWHSTLENATCLSALARYYRRQPQDAVFSGQLAIGDAEPIDFDNNTPTPMKAVTSGDEVTVSSEGTGSYFVTCTHRGLASEPIEQPYFDNGLKIRRQWLTADGKPVDPSAIKVGDLIRVQLTVSAVGLAAGEVLPNIAIIDALPGATEAENPALATSAVEYTAGTLATDSVQFEDDRVLVFASITNQPATFEYHLRVVGRGDFTLPPIEANCMYDGSLASRHGGGRITVTQ